MTKIPVLMYHALDSPKHPAESKDPGEQLYVLNVTLFEEQLKYLKENGYSTLLLEEVLINKILPQKTVVLTFDDGHVSNHTLALPLLVKYGFVAEFFITTGWIGEEHFLSEPQIQELAAADMGIGSHGVTHDYLDGLAEDVLRDELDSSKRRLEDVVGRKIISFSAPGGRMSKVVERVANALGYKLHCSSQIGVVQSVNVKTIPRVALKRKTTHEEFVKIIEGQFTYFFVNRFRYNILNILKKILGSERYSRAHSLLSRMKNL